MKTFVFIRHGATKGNLEKRYIGRTDEPVIGSVSRDIGLPDCENTRIFTSPRLRCVQTAQILFPDMPYTIVDDLRECDFGIFEGKTADELSDCAEYSAWLETGCMGDIPGGDSVTEFKERCVNAFISLAEEDDSGTAVIVTHGGVIMSILERLGEPRRGFYDHHIPNGGVLHKIWSEGRLISPDSTI